MTDQPSMEERVARLERLMDEPDEVGRLLKRVEALEERDREIDQFQPVKLPRYRFAGGSLIVLGRRHEEEGWEKDTGSDR